MSAQPKAVKIPASYFCSITGQVMMDPVFTADGQTYEREAIEAWLKTHDTSPKTGQKLPDKKLTPNWDKKGDISELLAEHPELYEKDEVYLPKAWLQQLAAEIKGNKTNSVQEWLAKDKRLLTTKLAGNYKAFHLACEFGSAELTQLLLEKLQKSNQLDKVLEKPSNFKPFYLNVLLEQSLVKKDKSTFTLLLTLGAELEQSELFTQNTLLHRMVIQGRLEAVSWLLEQGANLESCNAEGNTPLLLSLLHNKVEISEFLLTNKTKINVTNNKGETPLSIALLTQNKAMLSLLVGEKKASLPPLHLALELNDIGMLKVLLERKDIGIEALDEEKRTSFLAAVEKRNIEIARLLLEKGANPAVTGGTQSSTALHIAVEHNNLEILKLLLETKAASLIDVLNVNGDTPLHIAVKLGQQESITLLLKAGAFHKIKNAQGQTPSELAIAQGYVNLANLIDETVRTIKRAKNAEIKALQQKVKDQSIQIEQLNKHLQSQQEKAINPLLKKIQILEQEKAVIQKEHSMRIEQLEKQLIRQSISIEQEREAHVKLQAKLEQGKKALINQFNHLRKNEQTNSTNPKNLLLKTLREERTESVNCLQLLPSGELISGSSNGTIKVWDLKSSNCLKTLRVYIYSLDCLQLLPSGELVSSSGSAIKVWDLKSGDCLKTLKGHTHDVRCLQLLPSGELVSGSGDETIKVWDLKSGNCLKTLKKEHTHHVSCLQLLPNGELVSGSLDRTIKIWDLKSGNCLRTLKEHTSAVRCLQLLSSGELVSGSDDNTIKIWDLKSGNCLRTLKEHTSAVRCLQLLPNGELVSGSDDNTIRVWDLKSGYCLKTLHGHTDFVRCLQLLPNGELVSGSSDKTIKVWDLTEFVKVLDKKFEEEQENCRVM